MRALIPALGIRGAIADGREADATQLEGADHVKDDTAVARVVEGKAPRGRPRGSGARRG